MREDYEFDFDQRVADDDDDSIIALSDVQLIAPQRKAWRFDLDAAPIGKPLHIREPNSLRINLAIREDDGWIVINKDGVYSELSAIGSWAFIVAPDEWI